MLPFDSHRARDYNPLQHLRDDESRLPQGIFIPRSLSQPNAIGVSEVDLHAIEGNVLRVSGRSWHTCAGFEASLNVAHMHAANRAHNRN